MHLTLKGVLLRSAPGECVKLQVTNGRAEPANTPLVEQARVEEQLAPLKPPQFPLHNCPRLSRHQVPQRVGRFIPPTASLQAAALKSDLLRARRRASVSLKHRSGRTLSSAPAFVPE